MDLKGLDILHQADILSPIIIYIIYQYFFYKKDRNIFGMIFNMCALNDLDSNFRCEEIQMFFSLLKLLTL